MEFHRLPWVASHHAPTGQESWHPSCHVFTFEVLCMFSPVLPHFPSWCSWAPWLAEEKFSPCLGIQWNCSVVRGTYFSCTQRWPIWEDRTGRHPPAMPSFFAFDTMTPRNSSGLGRGHAGTTSKESHWEDSPAHDPCLVEYT